jgi:hypothetical protein
MFSRVPKNGCREEALPLGTLQRLERAAGRGHGGGLALARLARWGRTCPDLDAKLCYEAARWTAAFWGAQAMANRE